MIAIVGAVFLRSVWDLVPYAGLTGIAQGREFEYACLEEGLVRIKWIGGQWSAYPLHMFAAIHTAEPPGPRWA